LELKQDRAMNSEPQFTGYASDETALKLVLAFYCIMEEDKRNQVLALAQRYAAQPNTVSDDVIHHL
jgi:hypothetical protein